MTPTAAENSSIVLTASPLECRAVEAVANAAKSARELIPMSSLNGRNGAQRTTSDPEGLPLGQARKMLHYPSGDLPAERAGEGSSPADMVRQTAATCSAI
jgi:hypothetical protein